MAVLLLWWAITLLALFWLVAGGPWVLVLVVGVVGVLVVANTLVLVRHTGPEEWALEPGRLRQVDLDRDDTVAVWASRASRGARERGRRVGTLAYHGGRLSFTVDAPPGPPAATGGSSTRRPSDAADPLAGVAILDAPAPALRLGPRPRWRRPALVVHDDDVVHVLELSPPWDLGGGSAGAVVAAAWWDQLHELGARIE